MRRALASLAVAAALFGAAVSHDATPRQFAPRCEEDQPCWDCATMGNLICGPDGVYPETWSEMYAETLPGPFSGSDVR
jgi:hypothetical protein